MIGTYKLQDSKEVIPIILHLVILGENLTQQATAEFKTFQASTKNTFFYDDVPLQFSVVLHTIDHIINGKWRANNKDWRDLLGNKVDRINLRNSTDSFISDNVNAVFYCYAIDLVNAYDSLGYQLFEPNVRANLKSSQVNEKIRESLQQRRSRKEFRFLNNGVSMICDNFSKPSQQRQSFSVFHPGIVNGLQTVVALHTVYRQLSPEEKQDFEKNCTVLVRLLMSNAVEDINKVVTATNNQNPMKPRNLVSNSSEQLVYSQIFAEKLGWFYEAKEGAWDAFESDPKRWRPALNKLPKEFKLPGKRTVKKIDNEDLAQYWLAFIGFSREAINEKKGLFDGRFYSFIFTQQTNKHGFDYDFSFSRAKENITLQPPDAHLMLVAFLARTFANSMSFSASQNKQDACKRLKIDPTRMSKADLDSRLYEDNLFLLNQVLGGMSILFTEFLGFVFYRSFGDQLQKVGRDILKNHSFSLMTQLEIEKVKERADTQEFHEQDLLIVLWLAFVDTIGEMLAGEWGQSYKAANVKVRFVFSNDTRNLLYKKIQNTNDYMKKRSVKEVWAAGIPEKQGLFEFVRSCITT